MCVCVQFQTLDDLYCKYKFVVGPDWKAVGGPDAGTSQTSRKGSADDEEVVWNFPVDVAFKATSAYGWPRIVLSVRTRPPRIVCAVRRGVRDAACCMPWPQVYRQDSFGRDIIQGYGSMLVPTVPGRYTRFVRMFAPVSSSPFQSILVWLTGNKPEVRAWHLETSCAAPPLTLHLPLAATQFYHPEFVARSDGREGTRLRDMRCHYVPCVLPLTRDGCVCSHACGVGRSREGVGQRDDARHVSLRLLVWWPT